jgi:hypothetical protein
VYTLLSRITDECEMDGCKTRSPHEQHDTAAVGSVILLVHSSAVASCSVEPMPDQLVLDPADIEVLLTLRRR